MNAAVVRISQGFETEMAVIERTVAAYAEQLRHHPVARVLGGKVVPVELLKEYATLQYIDSVLWVPMLALMKDRVSNPKLKRSLTDNLLCEAGAKHTSHITLCREFIQSLGISPYFGSFESYSKLATQPVEMMNAVSGLSEAEIAGWILVAEALVPALFGIALPAFERIPGVDTTYLREHITVDADEHSQWMRESALELLEGGTSLSEILDGVHLGGRTALAVPDALYAKHVRGGFSILPSGVA